METPGYDAEAAEAERADVEFAQVVVLDSLTRYGLAERHTLDTGTEVILETPTDAVA